MQVSTPWMSLLLLVGYAAGIMYGVDRVFERPEGVEKIRTVSSEGVSMDLYLREVGRDVTDAPFPLLMQKLKSIPEIAMERGDKTYRIVPFESIEIVSEGGKKSHGRFHKMAGVGSEVVATYVGGGNDDGEDIYTNITVIFSFSDEEERIEKIYSGWSESCLLKVSTPRLMIKDKKKVLSIHLDYGSEDAERHGGHWLDGVGSEGVFDDKAILKKEMMIFEGAGGLEGGLAAVPEDNDK